METTYVVHAQKIVDGKNNGYGLLQVQGETLREDFGCDCANRFTEPYTLLSARITIWNDEAVRDAAWTSLVENFPSVAATIAKKYPEVRW